MPMSEAVRNLIDADIDAIREATAILDEAGFQVVGIDGIDRDETDGQKVRWAMTVEKDARTTSLGDFDG